ncbi:MAG TPA: 6-bladed beta-propeller, partial [Acidobacteriota bacterium]|nr:6-bladed beta-propeller [Acidobacteriota bacterium]
MNGHRSTRRAVALAFGLVLLFAVAGWAQTIENAAKPKAANGGRVITPQQVAVITDEGTSDFYFKRPYRLRTAPDGTLLFTDDSQILQFDANGKFLRNLFKKGQGPGEMPYPGTPIATDTQIIVYSGYPNKLVYFSRTGRYEKEIALRSTGGRTSLTLIGYQAGRFYFESGEFPRTT